VSGQCEVLVKCERTLDLPRGYATGAPQAAAKLEKAEFGKYNDLTELLEAEYGAANQKFPFLFLFRLAAGGQGGSTKNGKEIFVVCPREASSVAEAQNHHATGAYASVPSHHVLRACEVGSRKG